MLLKVIPRNPCPHTFAEIVQALWQTTSQNFLAQLCNYLNLNDGMLVGSGREALYYILKSLLKEGDEIILPAFSCNVLLGAIHKAGLKPIFADVSVTSLNMELEHIEPLITEKTRAILVTHQFGYPADIEEIKNYADVRKILVIEDAAPAFGAKYKGQFVGTIGDVGFFSFQQSKVISTLDGGLIVGKEEILRQIRQYFPRSYSQPSIKFYFKALEDCFVKNEHVYALLLHLWSLLHQKYTVADRLDLDLERYTTDTYKTLSKFQNQLGLQQLDFLQNILQVRQEAAGLYRQELNNLSHLICLPQSELNVKLHTYSRFPILVTDKDMIYQKARKLGVDLGFTFSYKLPQYFENEPNSMLYPNTDFIIAHVLNIPIHRNMNINRNIISKVKIALG